MLAVIRKKRKKILINIFTEREREVLNLVLQGLNNKEISQCLVISNHTTKAHVASIYKKLGVTNRVQAAVKCIILGAGKYFNLKDKIK